MGKEIGEALGEEASLLDVQVLLGPGLDSARQIVAAIADGSLKMAELDASAMLDILTGKVNPSGRLAESYPIRYEDTPALWHFPSTERNAEYRESIYVGYQMP